MSAAVIGWPGTTYYEDFKELGMAIGGKVWFQPMQGIWVDCTACGRRDAMRGGDLSAIGMSCSDHRPVPITAPELPEATVIAFKPRTEESA